MAMVKVTLVPVTGLPWASVTRTLGGVATELPAAATWPSPSLSAIVVASPGMMVIVPESIEVRPPTTGWIAAVPTRSPVKVALIESPAATRSPSATPPVSPVSDQVAATLATKLPESSRLIA